MAERLEAAQFTAVAQWIVAEMQVRKGQRSTLERQWKEIDRQLEMTPLPRFASSGNERDWYPAIEEPLQFNALEVIMADVRTGLFPPGRPDWYQVTGQFDDENMRKAETDGLIQEGVPVKMDQDSLDAIIKAVMEHYHRVYDFRSRFMLFVAECIKYGTGVARVREVKLAKFTHEFRGINSQETRGPAFLPMRIRNTYLDNSPALTMHEGISIAPVVLSCEPRLYKDLMLAASKGGSERGWRQDALKTLKPKKADEKRGVIEVIEAEGDFVVPGDGVFLPNSRIMVALGQGGPVVIRYESSPFHSTVTGYYLRQDVGSAYGVSPLMKGQPIQEAASFALNDLLACGALNAQPPVAYDRNDARFAASGGPDIYPRAQWGVDGIDGIKPVQIGDPAVLLQTYLALINKYEDLTQANDARRGAGVKSHTTTGAYQVDAQRALSRTEDFIQDIIEGPLTSILYMEYEVIRSIISKPVMIPINSQGMKGYIRVTKNMLPERVYFSVHGAAGVADEAQRNQQFFAAINFVIQLYAAAAQAGKPVELNFEQIIMEAFQRAGIQDTARFTTPAQPVPAGPAAASTIQGAGEVNTAQALEAI